jgi:hypothetical protein
VGHFSNRIAGGSNPSGAGKWTATYTELLKAVGVTHVAIIPDADEPGRAYAEAIARTCIASGY